MAGSIRKNGNGKKRTRKPGRPKRVFTNGDRAKLLKLAEAGATDREMAEAVRTSLPTLYKAYAEDPKLFDSVKAAKGIADERVERSLYERALGYDYFEEGTTKDGPCTLKRHMPAHPTAQIFWLKNRRSHEWKDRHEHKISADETVAGFFARVAEADGA